MLPDHSLLGQRERAPKRLRELRMRPWRGHPRNESNYGVQLRASRANFAELGQMDSESLGSSFGDRIGVMTPREMLQLGQRVRATTSDDAR